jgi:hypothetical protein
VAAIAADPLVLGGRHVRAVESAVDQGEIGHRASHLDAGVRCAGLPIDDLPQRAHVFAHRDADVAPVVRHERDGALGARRRRQLDFQPPSQLDE